MAGQTRFPSPSRREFLEYTAAALALPRASFGFAETSPTWPEPPRLGTVRAGGDLRSRAQQNMARLESDAYQPPRVFASPNAKSWPGDLRDARSWR